MNKAIVITIALLLISLQAVFALDSLNDGLFYYLPLNNTVDDFSENSIPTYAAGNLTPCYQEHANVSTDCGGLNTGNYEMENPNWYDANLYMNYTIPSNYTGAIWQIRHGNLATYNITIPGSCFIAHATIMQLRLYSKFGNAPYRSYGQCYNGTHWETIGNTEENAASGTLVGTNGAWLMTDGDFDTYSNPDPDGNNGHTSLTSGAVQARIYEDAIFWVTSNYTINKDGEADEAINLNPGNYLYMNSSFLQTPNFSVNFWFNGTQTDTAKLLMFGDDGARVFVDIRSNGSLHLHDDLQNEGLSNYTDVISNNTWYMLTLNSYEDGSKRLYLNKDIVLTSQGSNFSHIYPNNLYIGRHIPPSNNFYNGTIDEFRIYNRTLESWDIDNLYNIYDNNAINIESTFNVDNQTNGDFDVEVNLSNFGAGSNCTIYYNVSVLECSNTSANVSCNVTGDLNSTAELQLVCYDSNNNNLPIYFGDNETWNIDTIDPTIVADFDNASTVAFNNITGQFNFSDAYSLYSWNITVDGVEIDSATNVAYDDYIYNLSLFMGNWTAGEHTLSVKVADGHTAKQLKGNYKVKYPLLSRNKLTFEYYDKDSVRIEPQDGSFFDSFSTEKLKDRYSFTYQPNDKTKTKYEFKVVASRDVQIVNRPHSKYKQWLVIGDHWLDFYMSEQNVDISYKRLNDKEIMVTLQHQDKKAILRDGLESFNFQSTGDLNIVEQNFTFYSISATSTHTDPVYEKELTNFNLTLNISNTSYSYNNFTLEFSWNNTNYSVTQTSDVNYVYGNVELEIPEIEANTQVNFTWNITVEGEGTYSMNNTQNLSKVSVADCVDEPGWTESLVLYGYDEETLELFNASEENFTLNMNINVTLDDGGYKKFSFEFNGSNNYSICIDPANSTFDIIGKMEFGVDPYTDRKYHLYDYTLTNVSSDIYLYHLLDTEASDIVLTVYDRTTGETIQGAYVKVLRYYPGHDNESGSAYRTVEIEQTDVNGQTLAKMVLGDVWYKFIVEYPAGTVLLNTEIEKILDTSLLLPVSLTSGSLLQYDEVLGMAGDVSCTKSTQTCRFTWSDTSGTVATGELRIYEDTGYAKRLIYSESIASAASTIAYTIPGNITNRKFLAEGWILTI